mmetsp:Transcript_53449/g.125401  ORF Transcript_53449/g.125401 Transcript_53449/m.125401 type:complete len:202 (-) Transcript_53449:8-613(-)
MACPLHIGLWLDVCSHHFRRLKTPFAIGKLHLDPAFIIQVVQNNAHVTPRDFVIGFGPKHKHLGLIIAQDELLWLVLLVFAFDFNNHCVIILVHALDLSNGLVRVTGNLHKCTDLNVRRTQPSRIYLELARAEFDRQLAVIIIVTNLHDFAKLITVNVLVRIHPIYELPFRQVLIPFICRHACAVCAALSPSVLSLSVSGS